METPKTYIHPTAEIEPSAKIGNGVQIWHYCHVRKSSQINDLVSLGKGVFIDKNVEIGRGSRIQNAVNIYQGVIVNSWCFIGPNVTFTNDTTPRAGSLQWEIKKTILSAGSSIGAGSIINSGLTIGHFALVGAGSVVTTNIPDFWLAYGLPARPISKICACGETRLEINAHKDDHIKSCCHKKLLPEVIELAKQIIEQKTLD